MIPPLAFAAALAAAAPPPPAAVPSTPPPAAARRAPSEAIPIQPRRINTVVVSIDVGAPVERAVPNRTYARAVAADAELRWTDAEPLYREAHTEWSAAARLTPSRALELAIAKAERERQRSQALAGRARAAATRGDRDPGTSRNDALEEARLLRAKLMATRALLERVPPALYARTLDRLQAARRVVPDEDENDSGLVAREGEINLLLCATHAAAGESAAARLDRARVTEADRADPSNSIALAACAAALGETRAALAALELALLHPVVGRIVRDTAIYESNDWDRLRGDRRFESLFPR
jgi:hypothetical protein